ncbi:hypothetical protein [Lysinibacillus sp. C5.1]|uniref:hypothetical protein n=1 Tax=Lysinibacillus sp. C5.1 TaxID=2796169 RepID=UPI0030818A86
MDVLLFLLEQGFGNKIKDGKLINEDGVQEEFEIAAKEGKVIIPVVRSVIAPSNFHYGNAVR